MRTVANRFDRIAPNGAAVHVPAWSAPTDGLAKLAESGCDPIGSAGRLRLASTGQLRGWPLRLHRNPCAPTSGPGFQAYLSEGHGRSVLARDDVPVVPVDSPRRRSGGSGRAMAEFR